MVVPFRDPQRLLNGFIIFRGLFTVSANGLRKGFKALRKSYFCHWRNIPPLATQRDDLGGLDPFLCRNPTLVQPGRLIDPLCNNWTEEATKRK